MFMAHQHDTHAVAVAWHTAGAFQLVATAGIQCIAIGAAPRQPCERSFLHTMHAFVWMVNAISWLHMSFGLYIFPDFRGVHHLLSDALQLQGVRPESIVFLYLTLHCWLAAVLVGVLGAFSGGGTAKDAHGRLRIESALENTMLLQEAEEAGLATVNSVGA